MKEYLVFFVHRHLDFRFPEIDALLTMQSLKPEDCYSREANPLSSPVVQIKLPSVEHAKFLSQRGILVKGVYEIWGHGKNYDEVVASVANFEDRQAIVANEQLSWKINVEAFGLKLSMEQQTERRERFRAILPFAGPVVMTNPSNTFLILEDIGVDESLMTPHRIFFLRTIAGAERNRGRGGARDLVDMQTLKRRAYIGPTSMDAEMALLMCNMALVNKGDLVIDPFVGTGSVLVPCATFGGICMGTDIDTRVLHGKNNKSIYSNFHQYNLPVPELVRADNSRTPLKCPGYFDAVVCDPPYGIRAGARKSGRRERPDDPNTSLVSQTGKAKYGPRVIPEEWLHNHIPATQPYAAEDVMNDLLTFAATNLRVGGRVVYLLPTTYDYTDDDLPVHPLLRVIANSEEKLTTKYARRLITMERVSECEAQVAIAKPKKQFSFAKLRERIIETNAAQKRNVKQKSEHC
ncbi:tRNA guanosine-2'-O-methyltransferase [Thraustotheca clavata]|uniref:tRNA (guanine(10)-N(2))-methyltransferase n=1 Tax=Thraustotheca clavata TaxID=74557 RepID=A0A1V9ZRQ6_9STRA|nr:tRNA guanosine-2'-O-methyltransferase [Thraustotheca clavata]